MLAAATAAESAPVTLFNKNPWPGKKVAAIPPDEFIFTEKLPPARMAARFGDKSAFVEPFLKNFSYADLVKFLKKIGFTLKPDEYGHFHSNGYKPNAIINALSEKAIKSGAKIIKSARVTDLVIEKGSVKGVVINGGTHPASAVILATGSFSSPKFGSTQDGYEIARKAGHTVNAIKPAMVDLLIKEKAFRFMAGVSMNDIGLTIFADDKPIFDGRGAVKFTNYGISGPLILDNSAEVIEYLSKGKVELALDFVPDFSRERIDGKLIEAQLSNARLKVNECLNEFVDRQTAMAIGKLCNIDVEKSLLRLTNLERKALIVALKDFRLTVSGSRPFNYTRGVKGGVSVDEINPLGGESKLVKNLFFAGAVMDVLGPWGGFNMQFAFSSGYVAGKAAATAFARSK